MGIPQLIMEKVQTLPIEKQQEILDFTEFVAQRNQKKKPRVSLKGLWADLGVKITAEDIDEIRKEMWANFPREDI